MTRSSNSCMLVALLVIAFALWISGITAGWSCGVAIANRNAADIAFHGAFAVAFVVLLLIVFALIDAIIRDNSNADICLGDCGDAHECTYQRRRGTRCVMPIAETIDHDPRFISLPFITAKPCNRPS